MPCLERFNDSPFCSGIDERQIRTRRGALTRWRRALRRSLGRALTSEVIADLHGEGGLEGWDNKSVRNILILSTKARLNFVPLVKMPIATLDEDELRSPRQRTVMQVGVHLRL